MFENNPPRSTAINPFTPKISLVIFSLLSAIQLLWSWFGEFCFDQKKFRNLKEAWQFYASRRLNPLTPKISIIVLTVHHTVLAMLVWRIWYWINLQSPNWYFSLFSSLAHLILYCYCKEKFCLGHSWESKG